MFNRNHTKQSHALYRCSRSRSLTLCCVVACVMVVGLDPITTQANPTVQDYDKPLSAHDTITGAEKQIQLMYAKFAEWEKLVISSTAAANSGGRIPHQQLSKIYPETYRGIWYAEQLQAMGEPAGVDLLRKFTMLKTAMGVFASKLGEFHPKEIDKLKKDNANRLKMLAKVRELTDQGKLVEAEREIQAYHLKQLTSIFYLTYSQSKEYENQVNPIHEEILRQLNAQRKSEYLEKAKEKINAFADAVTTLQRESDRIRKELASSPTVTLGDGKTGDAADAIRYVHTLWGNVCASMSRSLALAWAFGGRGVEDTADPFNAKLREVESIATTAISGIVLSAAQSTPPDQMGVLLPRILTELAVIDRRYVGKLDGKITDAVDQLAAKNSVVAEQVKRYGEATVEPTRWMRRFTLQQAERLGPEYSDAAGVLNQKLTAESSVQPAIYGPAATRDQVFTVGSLSRPASWLAGDAKVIVGMKIKEQGTLRLSPNAKLAIVPQDPRHYTNMPATFPIEKYLDEVKQSLLLDDSHGPLDLDSADAITSAELQEFDSVGGSIVALTLEPFLSRFATMPDAAHTLVPLNRLPAIDVRGDAIDKIIWRVDMKPDWVAHRYFLAR
ncbi:MAG: hypothetical protein KDB00_22855 [Planctomycetales bacterium]|nr:hypothetical protein [Planctomycetales bacterium]